jgi:K+-transporting ATPase KdpF subunit
MTLFQWIGAVVAVLLLVYLVIAMIDAEKL